MRLYLFASLAISVGLSMAQDARLNRLPYRGFDWSSVKVQERAGFEYKDLDGTVKPLEDIIFKNGINIVRQRLWVDPIGKSIDYGLNYNIELANRAQKAGLMIYLDIFYSETWADPGQQNPPEAWKGLDFEQMRQKVYDYTKETIEAFLKAGVKLEIISIGNEISGGMLGQLGDFRNPDGPKHTSAFLKAGSKGIKAATAELEQPPKIMLHLDSGADLGRQRRFYDNVIHNDEDSDLLTIHDFHIQGVTYYPFWWVGATFHAVETSLSYLRRTYSKEIMIVETGWPTSCDNPKVRFPKDMASIPFSPEGQVQFITRSANLLKKKDVQGTGLFYFEGAWLQNRKTGSHCEDVLMFDTEGKALPSLEVFKDI